VAGRLFRVGARRAIDNTEEPTVAEQLTSVRFDSETLDHLRTLADVHETNVAEEVRRAVTMYVAEVISSKDFRSAAEAALARRQERIDKLLTPA
jgi:hypothetical protein